jgi:hypothetical protein
MTSAVSSAPTPLYKILIATFLGSVSGGAFWSAIFFVTANAFAFSSARNLMLASVMGVAYTVGALCSGPLVRGAARWLSVRSVLVSALWAWAAFAALPLFLAPRSEASVWIAALGGSFTSAFVWPIMESYMSAGRHGASMRQTVGRFNITWTPAVAVPLLFMPLVARWNILACVALCALFNFVSSLVVLTFPANPSHHDEASSRQAVGNDYVFLARATVWMLPFSYVLVAALSPLLPSRLSELEVSQSTAPLWAATWMVARFAFLAFLWRSSFWHGRWWPLLWGGFALLGGAGLVLLAPWAWLCVAGLACLGCGLAMVYYASLYYGLAVGQAKVDAGGKFEALVGIGYVVGPALGLVGTAATSVGSANHVTLALFCIVAAIAAAGPVSAYRSGRNEQLNS